MRTIFRTRDAPFSYGQELRKAQNVVEKVIKNGNRTLIKYIKVVAKLRTRGNDLFVARIKKISDLVIENQTKEKIRMINLYFYNLDPSGAQRFIEKFERSEGR
jgi:hypothetical protein